MLATDDPTPEKIEVMKMAIRNETFADLRNGKTKTGGFHGRKRPAMKAPEKRIYRGVSWIEGAHRWQAQISNANKPRHLGKFVTQIEAARAYDAALVRFADPLWKRKANFPSEIEEAMKRALSTRRSQAVR